LPDINNVDERQWFVTTPVRGRLSGVRFLSTIDVDIPITGVVAAVQSMMEYGNSMLVGLPTYT